MPLRSYAVTTTDGRALRVYETGDPRGPAVFYLHGTPVSGRPYGPHEQDAIRRGLRLIGYDRPGYGGSTPQPGRTVGSVAKDVAAIADHLRIERFGVWGISGGGPHALACGALLGRRAVAVAALASPAPYPADGLDWMRSMGQSNLEEFQASLKGPEALDPLLTAARDLFLGPDLAPIDASFDTLLSKVDRAAYEGGLRSFLLEAGREGLAPGVAGWRDDDLAFVRPWGFAVQDVRVPVTLWQGRQDLFVPYAHGKWLAEHISHSIQNLTEDDGHLTLYQQRIPLVHSWLRTYLGR